ncbi:MAG: FtsX-like permease family protein [Rhodocyclaceae bacterium]|nr:MAG: FtsX-like permease family protein [Rhodocyclaceae bacterium]
MKIWLTHHREAAALALRRLAAAPVNSLLSLLAIGIALSLPAGGQMLLINALHLAGATSAVPQISLFMAANAERRTTTEIESRLAKYGGIKQVRFLPREETLARMKANPGLRDVIEALPDNPFPDAFIVTATDDRPEAMEKLAVEFRQWPKVEHVQLDSAWVRRLDALLKLGRTAVMLLGALLGAGLIAISFSIIRMQTLMRRAEIEVSQLLGATDGFIRRPFLYFGALLGLGGGLVAWLLVGAAALWLRAPLGELVRLYDLTLVLQNLDARDSALLLGAAATLGWLGALVSLRQHLRQD